MIRINRFAMLLIAASLFSAVFYGCDKSSGNPQAKVKIRHRTWQVEIANTEKNRYQGLSGRDNMPANHGMLFIYPKAKNLSFCMRGCKFPIDIVFIGPDCRVVNVYRMQVEPDLAGAVGYHSNLPAQYALELAGGAAGQAGIVVGDVVEFVDVPDPSTAEEGS